MKYENIKNVLEAILLSADKPMSVQQLDAIFEGDEVRPSRDDLRKALHDLAEDYATRSFELKQVASGFRIQVKQDYAQWVSRLWEEKPARYTRALLETLALIAYRQPITRGEIEEVRGVSVSSNIMRTLQERDWIKVLGHKDIPGKPALYGTTREFLDYFNLTSLDELPTLAAIKDLDKSYPELALVDHHAEASDAEQADFESATVAADDSQPESAIAEAGMDEMADDQSNAEAVAMQAEETDAEDEDMDDVESPSAAGA